MVYWPLILSLKNYSAPPLWTLSTGMNTKGYNGLSMRLSFTWLDCITHRSWVVVNNGTDLWNTLIISSYIIFVLSLSQLEGKLINEMKKKEKNMTSGWLSWASGIKLTTTGNDFFTTLLHWRTRDFIQYGTAKTECVWFWVFILWCCVRPKWQLGERMDGDQQTIINPATHPLQTCSQCVAY